MPSAHDSPAEHHPGDMNISEQTATFHTVVGLFKWGSLTLAASLVLLILWFCTPAGFLPGFVIALILVILGVAFLRDRKTSAH
jgi:hypothetical protein